MLFAYTKKPTRDLEAWRARQLARPASRWGPGTCAQGDLDPPMMPDHHERALLQLE